MTHPGPELTDYVDGTLPASAVARVEDHLRTCATCRREVDLATAARDAARATAEPAPPPGLADAAIAEAAGIAAARAPEVRSLDPSASHRPRPATPRWFAVLGAAAVIALIALLIPKLGQPGSSPSSMAAGAASEASYPQATAVEVQDTDYGTDMLARFVAAFDAAAVPGPASGGTGESAGSGSPAPISAIAGPDAAVKLSPERLPAATRCLDNAYDNQGGTPTRVILARYEGQPAYLGVYVQSPGAGLAPNVVLVVVASVHGCDPLSTGQFKLP